ncbi:restriction endonuclease, partial [Escherichia coli]|nr:restriction endonuclease [Escherichia coli]
EQLIDRRRIEYDIFLLVEEFHVLDIIRKGFGSVDEFIALANSVSNRRKSRAGKSLELHLEHLFVEHGLRHFATQAVTEGNKKPDFLFPSAEAYHDIGYPEENLRMLAVKTTCKDRWGQILNEADKIRQIHLFTLQEGVSQAQHSEMRDAG